MMMSSFFTASSYKKRFEKILIDQTYLPILMRILPLILIAILSCNASAQKNSHTEYKALRGSGQMVYESRTVKPFDFVEIDRFPAEFSVEVGGSEPSVDITIDDNFVPYLQISNEGNILKLSLKDPSGYLFWISKSTMRIKISTPTLSGLRNGSNGNVKVSGIATENFALTNDANGDVSLTGKVDRFDLNSSANGKVTADELLAQTANVIVRANATIYINATRVNVVKNGNGSVTNLANEKRNVGSSQIESKRQTQREIEFQFQNNSLLPRKVTLVSYEPSETGNGTESFMMAPFATRQKKYPIGTAIYIASGDQTNQVMRGGKLTGRPFLTVSARDEGRTVKLNK